MNRAGAYLLMAALSATRWASAEPPRTEADAEAPGAPVVVDGQDIGELAHIEDAALEGLLDFELEDKLGQTEAVSRQVESVSRAPATITTISGKELRLSGATTIPDLLRWVPGVQVQRSAPGNYVVSVRGTGGLAGNNILLLVDGIPINSPMDAGVDWDLIPLAPADVERIEVVRGPVSTVYGANAYTGVINIVSRENIGASPDYRLRAAGGTDLDGGAMGSLSGRFVHIGSSTQLKLFVTASHDAQNARAEGFRHPSHDQYGLLGVLGITLSPESRFSLELGRSISRRSSLDHLVLESEPQTRELLFGQAKLSSTGLPQPISRFELWARSSLQLIRSDPTAYDGLSYAGTTAQRGGLGADLGLALHEDVELSVGSDVVTEYVNAPYVHPLENAQVRPGYGAYGRLRVFPARSLDLGVSGRGEVTTVSDALQLSYRVFGLYHRDAWAVRLAAASAFRQPSYVEAGAQFRDPANGLILLEGDPSVRPPRNTSAELGAVIWPVSTVTIASTLYVSRLTNVMVQNFEPLVRRTFENDAAARTLLGAELEGSWRVSDRLSISPSFTYLYWLSPDGLGIATVGVPDQNSTYVAGVRLVGTSRGERFGWALNGLVEAGRRYELRGGIPPRILDEEVPANGTVSAMGEYQLNDDLPSRISLHVMSNLPWDISPSPLPSSAWRGNSIMLGLELGSE